MIPTTFTVLVAALSVNAAPLFSGFFAPRAVPPAPVQRRDLTSTQLAQGTNFYFGSLYLEAECTPGQVACLNGMTATCSGEANWETSPCAENTTCYAVPATSNESDPSLVVTCLSEEQVLATLGSQDVSIDYQITNAPLNTTVTDLPSNEESSSESAEVPTSTESSGEQPTGTEPVPEPTCVPEEGDTEGDDEDENPEDDPATGSVPAFTQSLGGEVPEPTGAPSPTCTEEPEEAEITEYITVIAFPNPTNPAEYSYSTVLPTETASVSEAVPTATESSEGPAPTEDPAPTEEPAPTEVTGSDANVPTESTSAVECTETYSESYEEPAPTESYEEPAPAESTSSTSEEVAPTDAPSPDPAAPTTVSVPPPAVSSPAPEVSIIGTHLTPARRGMMKLVRRS